MKPVRHIFAAMIAAIILPLGSHALKAAPLETAVAREQVMQNLRRFEGSVEAVNKSTVSAQTSGRIAQINFDVDDYVKAGAVIVRFYDTEHKARLKQAESALMAASARRLAAEQTFKRTQTLFKKGTVAKARLDTATSNFNSAKASEESSEAALQQAREQLTYTIVKAPYSGFVVQRHVQIGEIANPGQPLMTGFSLDKLRVKADVPQQFADAIRAGNEAVVYGPDNKAISATGLTVFPFADPKSNTVTIRIALPEGTKKVFPGMLVKTAFKIGEKTVLSIPQNSVVRRGEVIGAYVMDSNGKLHLQQIRTGRVLSDKSIEVLSGLKAGDKVAIDTLKASIQLKSSKAAN